MPPFRSVQFIPLSSRTLPALTRIDPADLQDFHFRSKFKLVWHQFSTVQFPRHHFVWKVHSVQFGALGQSASIQFVQFTNSSGPGLQVASFYDLSLLSYDLVLEVMSWPI